MGGFHILVENASRDVSKILNKAKVPLDIITEVKERLNRLVVVSVNDLDMRRNASTSRAGDVAASIIDDLVTNVCNVHIPRVQVEQTEKENANLRQIIFELKNEVKDAEIFEKLAEGQLGRLEEAQRYLMGTLFKEVTTLQTHQRMGWGGPKTTQNNTISMSRNASSGLSGGAQQQRNSTSRSMSPAMGSGVSGLRRLEPASLNQSGTYALPPAGPTPPSARVVRQSSLNQSGGASPYDTPTSSPRGGGGPTTTTVGSTSKAGAGSGGRSPQQNPLANSMSISNPQALVPIGSGGGGNSPPVNCMPEEVSVGTFDYSHWVALVDTEAKAWPERFRELEAHLHKMVEESNREKADLAAQHRESLREKEDIIANLERANFALLREKEGREKKFKLACQTIKAKWKTELQDMRLAVTVVQKSINENFATISREVEILEESLNFFVSFCEHATEQLKKQLEKVSTGEKVRRSAVPPFWRFFLLKGEQDSESAPKAYWQSHPAVKNLTNEWNQCVQACEDISLYVVGQQQEMTAEVKKHLEDNRFILGGVGGLGTTNSNKLIPPPSSLVTRSDTPGSGTGTGLSGAPSTAAAQFVQGVQNSIDVGPFRHHRSELGGDWDAMPEPDGAGWLPKLPYHDESILLGPSGGSSSGKKGKKGGKKMARGGTPAKTKDEDTASPLGRSHGPNTKSSTLGESVLSKSGKGAFGSSAKKDTVIKKEGGGPGSPAGKKKLDKNDVSKAEEQVEKMTKQVNRFNQLAVQHICRRIVLKARKTVLYKSFDSRIRNALLAYQALENEIEGETKEVLKQRAKINQIKPGLAAASEIVNRVNAWVAGVSKTATTDSAATAKKPTSEDIIKATSKAPPIASPPSTKAPTNSGAGGRPTPRGDGSSRPSTQPGSLRGGTTGNSGGFAASARGAGPRTGSPTDRPSMLSPEGVTSLAQMKRARTDVGDIVKRVRLAVAEKEKEEGAAGAGAAYTSTSTTTGGGGLEQSSTTDFFSTEDFGQGGTESMAVNANPSGVMMFSTSEPSTQRNDEFSTNDPASLPTFSKKPSKEATTSSLPSLRPQQQQQERSTMIQPISLLRRGTQPPTVNEVQSSVVVDPRFVAHSPPSLTKSPSNTGGSFSRHRSTPIGEGDHVGGSTTESLPTNFPSVAPPPGSVGVNSAVVSATTPQKKRKHLDEGTMRVAAVYPTERRLDGDDTEADIMRITSASPTPVHGYYLPTSALHPQDVRQRSEELLLQQAPRNPQINWSPSSQRGSTDQLPVGGGVSPPMSELEPWGTQ